MRIHGIGDGMAEALGEGCGVEKGVKVQEAFGPRSQEGPKPQSSVGLREVSLAARCRPFVGL